MYGMYQLYSVLRLQQTGISSCAAAAMPGRPTYLVPFTAVQYILHMHPETMMNMCSKHATKVFDATSVNISDMTLGGCLELSHEHGYLSYAFLSGTCELISVLRQINALSSHST